jgi:hypothetical protein
MVWKDQLSLVYICGCDWTRAVFICVQLVKRALLVYICGHDLIREVFKMCNWLSISVCTSVWAIPICVEYVALLFCFCPHSHKHNVSATFYPHFLYIWCNFSGDDLEEQDSSGASSKPVPPVPVNSHLHCRASNLDLTVAAPGSKELKTQK